MATFGGQLCTKPAVVFVPAGATGDAFVADVAGRLSGMEPSVLFAEKTRDGLVAGVQALDGEAERLRGPDSEPAAEEAGFRFARVAYRAAARDLVSEPDLLEERFGPVVLFLAYEDAEDLLAALERIGGQLTATVHADLQADAELLPRLVASLKLRAGRLLFDGFPTGVAVTWAMHHGGPFPATTAAGHTSVGMTAVRRFQRPVAYQSAPGAVLPTRAPGRQSARDLAAGQRRADAGRRAAVRVPEPPAGGR